MGQSLSLLSARIKLRQRHLREWDALASNQQKVLGFIREQNAPTFSLTTDNERVCIESRTKQTARLIKLMSCQYEEREQLKARHQQEERLLEQPARTLEQESTGDTI